MRNVGLRLSPTKVSPGYGEAQVHQDTARKELPNVDANGDAKIQGALVIGCGTGRRSRSTSDFARSGGCDCADRCFPRSRIGPRRPSECRNNCWSIVEEHRGETPIRWGSPKGKSSCRCNTH